MKRELKMVNCEMLKIPIKMWLDVEEIEEEALQQAKNLSKLFCAFKHIVVLPDCHVGYGMPIGTVIATKNYIIPNSVGVDIGCGILSLKTSLHVSEINIPLLKKVLGGSKENPGGIRSSIPLGFNHHSKKQDEKWMPVQTPPEICAQEYQKALKQIGTLGGGNHFIEIQKGDDEFIYVMIHSGSRNIGHTVAKHYIKIAKELNLLWGTKVPPEYDLAVLPINDYLGQKYLEEMQYCVDFAYQNRKLMIERVKEAFTDVFSNIQFSDEVNIAHNYCIPNSEIIPTIKGPKTIKELKIGDIIYSYSNKDIIKTKIKNIVYSGKKKIYTITVRGRKLRVSGDHPILTIDVKKIKHPNRKWHFKRIGEYKWVAAKNLNIKDIIVCAKNYYEKFKNEDSTGIDKARFIGAFLGDGWASLNLNDSVRYSYGIGLAIGKEHEVVTERYEYLLNKLFTNINWRNNAKGAFGLTTSNKELYLELNNLGIIKKSKNRIVPNFIFNLSKEEKIAFLSGYIDADGCVYKNGYGLINGASEKLVRELREICISVGIDVSILKKIERISNYGKNILYSFRISNKGMTKLDLWHDKKSKRVQSKRKHKIGLQLSKLGYLELPNNLYGQYVTKIEICSDIEDVWDIEVESENHSFICEGVIVHNCARENHFGENVLVHRKGATLAREDTIGLIPGSQGTSSYIVKGKGNKDSFCSCSHGAGRLMSREKAKLYLNINHEKSILDKQNILHSIRHENDLDEAPSAYKDISQVMKNQEDLVEILRELKPLAVIKG